MCVFRATHNTYRFCVVSIITNEVSDEPLRPLNHTETQMMGGKGDGWEGDWGRNNPEGGGHGLFERRRVMG